MLRLSGTKRPAFAGLVMGVAGFLLVFSWVLKIRHIQNLKLEIAAAETRLKATQDLWRNYPPLDPGKRKELQKTQERLLQGLPREKDIPGLFEEVSRLAKEHYFSEVAISIEDGPAGPGARKGSSESGPPRVAPSQPTPPALQASGTSGPIDSFPVKVNFTGDYREIAYFLEDLERIPRVLTIQTLELRRRVPVVSGEIALRGYYQKGSLPGSIK